MRCHFEGGACRRASATAVPQRRPLLLPSPRRRATVVVRAFRADGDNEIKAEGGPRSALRWRPGGGGAPTPPTPSPPPAPPPPHQQPPAPLRALAAAFAAAARRLAAARDARVYHYYNGRSAASDVRLFSGLYAALALALAALLHAARGGGGGADAAAEAAATAATAAAAGGDAAAAAAAAAVAHGALSASVAAAAPPPPFLADLYQVARWAFGEDLPPPTAPLGEQALAVLSAVAGLLGFALILALVEQVCAFGHMGACGEGRGRQAD